MDKLNVTFEGKHIEIDKGKVFKDFIEEDLKLDYHKIALCKVRGKYYELFKEMNYSEEIELIPFESVIGMKIYSRTLQFIFIKAALDLFKDSSITIQHSISKGLYGEIYKEEILSKEDIDNIKNRMKEIIKADSPIKKVKMNREDAIQIFKGYQMEDKVSLLESVDFKQVNLYELEGRYDYFYGQMAYSTGVIKGFDLIKYKEGFILRNPSQNNNEELLPYKEQEKLANIFIETERWLDILGIGEVGALNRKIEEGDVANLMMVSEALHEKKIAYIADEINSRSDVKVVLIAGPSSSGKTTFANRLSVQLRVNGCCPIPISLDDYFVDRDRTPIDEHGELDFESVYALDLDLFNEHLSNLLEGNEVEIPKFNFKMGTREWVGHKLKLPQNGILVIEGIHGLNPIVTKEIDSKHKFKIYISALTQLNLDDHNRIETSDVRRVRRIVRDYLSRGYGGEDTLKMWPSIGRGEEKNIFVYQEEADVMFNSTLVYELCVLKKYALLELEKIQQESPVFLEATRLKAFLGFFKEIPKELVPSNSILKEFVGGSIFYKY